MSASAGRFLDLVISIVKKSKKTIDITLFICYNLYILMKGDVTMDNNKLIRFLLTFFLGWIGSIIINHTNFKPEGYTSRTIEYFILGIITMGIYPLVASICNLTFDPAKAKNIGYKKD